MNDIHYIILLVGAVVIIAVVFFFTIQISRDIDETIKRCNAISKWVKKELKKRNEVEDE